MLSLALLEVMDKEPSLFGIWVATAGFAGIGFWSARRWVWPGVLFLAWDALSFWGTHDELTDPFVGPAILQEAGKGYVIQSYVAHAISISATAVGLVWGIARWRRRRAEGKKSAGPGVVPVS